jgi:hypothetical protein
LRESEIQALLEKRHIELIKVRSLEGENELRSFTVFTVNTANSSKRTAKKKRMSPTQLHSSRSTSSLREGHALLDLGDGESGVKALGASPAAVQDGVATVQAHAVVEAVHALCGLLVTRVGDPAVRLHEDGGAEVLLAVPPV